jgi:Alkylmercury lyase
MMLFRSEEHVDRWCSQWNRPRGATMSLAQGWMLAQLWYGNRLHPEWRVKSTQEARAVFAQVGLLGDFWQLD